MVVFDGSRTMVNITSAATLQELLQRIDKSGVILLRSFLSKSSSRYFVGHLHALPLPLSFALCVGDGLFLVLLASLPELLVSR